MSEAGERPGDGRRALVLTVSDGVVAGDRATTRRASGSPGGSASSASRSSGRSCPTSGWQIEAALVEGGDGARPDRHDRRHGPDAARRDARRRPLAVIDYEVPGLAEAMRGRRVAGRRRWPTSRGRRRRRGRAPRRQPARAARGGALESLDGDRAGPRARARDARRAVRPRRRDGRRRSARPARRRRTRLDVRGVLDRPGLPARLPALLGRRRRLRPRHGPPPAGLRRRPGRRARARSATSRAGRSASSATPSLQTKMFRDRRAGLMHFGDLLGLRPPHDRHGQRRDRRARPGGPRRGRSTALLWAAVSAMQNVVAVIVARGGRATRSGAGSSSEARPADPAAASALAHPGDDRRRRRGRAPRPGLRGRRATATFPGRSSRTPSPCRSAALGPDVARGRLRRPLVGAHRARRGVPASTSRPASTSTS